ncbi:hypothetical protein CNMCM8927_003503 [Aspergillus lentulus]|uniref:Major facilitator superfamily (MFS) profile domain-containing protein n=1 Tax=Aspergillus lentulus TaxID=293939 RepID=A0AAN6BL13_ASPLE|nr:hypothetical protein CNMCM8927_003503 [Aspergillus lentulus]
MSSLRTRETSSTDSPAKYNEDKSDEVVYKAWDLFIYDIWVLGIVSTWAWGCSTTKYLLPQFRSNIGKNHLDIGSGTGYYLRKAGIPASTRLTLIDKERSALSVGLQRSGRADAHGIVADILEPLDLTDKFDSVSMYYLLHCIPATVEKKCGIFAHIKHNMTSDGVIHGANVLGRGVRKDNAFAAHIRRGVLRAGIFHNEEDNAYDFEHSLRQNFEKVETKDSLLYTYCLNEENMILKDLETGSGSQPHPDPDLVSWSGPDDQANPKNWPTKRKWIITVIVSLFAFLSPVSSSMVAPALGKLRDDLEIPTKIEVEMAMSIFILGYAVGPLFFSPLSELYGRSRILQGSNLFYLAWNLGCGFVTNRVEIFVFRFLAGVGGSAAMSVGGGTLSDIWDAEQRGKAVGIYSLAPLLGPVLGPIAGGWTAERTTWRWVFWATTIAAGCVQIAALVWLKETHALTLLRRKCHRLIKSTGNTQLHLDSQSQGKTPLRTLLTALQRPSRLLVTQPIVIIVALYMAYLFGLTYLVTVTLPVVWSEVYHESLGIGGLNYISLGLGAVIGVQGNIHFVDRIYRQLKEKNNGVGQPEFRLPSMFIGSVITPIGLFWYGWSVQAGAHWIMPNIGTAILSAGIMICLQSMQNYIIDSYTVFAASALAATVVLRSLAGFAFPLFAPYLYDRLDYGWGTSVLAFISIAVGIPSPFIFWYFGPKLRELSPYAKS